MSNDRDRETERARDAVRRRTVGGQAIDFLNELNRERREAEARDGKHREEQARKGQR